MRRTALLIVFTALTALNLLLVFVLKDVNFGEIPGFSEKILDFRGQYDVRIDLEFLESNFGSAHE